MCREDSHGLCSGYSLRRKQQALETCKERGTGPEAVWVTVESNVKHGGGKWIPRGRLCSVSDLLQTSLSTEPGSGQGWLLTGPRHVGKLEKLSSTVSTSCLEARKGQDELRGRVGKPASWPIWFLQLLPTAPNTDHGARVQRPHHPGSLQDPKRQCRALGFPKLRT